MYLLEFEGQAGGAARTNTGATSKVRVNHAIGGWDYGDWSISLDKDRKVYNLDMKVTVGVHEGSINYVIDRGSWSYNQKSSGYACGTGHTIANQLTYNPELDQWARLCWTDWNDEDGACSNDEACKSDEDWNTKLWATYFQTLPDGERAQILKLPGAGPGIGTYRNRGPGGVSSIVSLGAQGWLGVGYRPLGLSGREAKNKLQNEADKEFSSLPLTVTIVKLPPSSSNCGSQCTNFTDLSGLPGAALWNYDGASGALGFVNAQRLSKENELLVGYATKISHPVSSLEPEFRVAKITTSGEVLATQRLTGTGWGEGNMWVRLSNGCIAFPFVWKGAPGAVYGNRNQNSSDLSGFSRNLRITVLCDSWLAA